MEVTSVDSFTLDDISCSEIGLWCDTPPIQVLGEMNGTNYQVGSDTDMYVSDDSYKDITFRFTAYAFFKTDFDMHTVYDFLRGKSELRMSRNDGYFWKIRSISCNPTQTQDGQKIKFQISIKCAPWRYVDNETPVNVTQSGTNVACGGTRFCKPLYKLTLSAYTGTGAFTVNGQQVTIVIAESMGTDTLYIDSEKQIAYDGSQNPQMRTPLTSGIFPWMSVGNNAVTFGGIISSIQVTRRQRCY